MVSNYHGKRMAKKRINNLNTIKGDNYDRRMRRVWQRRPATMDMDCRTIAMQQMYSKNP
jgi:hypothetical protein